MPTEEETIRKLVQEVLKENEDLTIDETLEAVIDQLPDHVYRSLMSKAEEISNAGIGSSDGVEIMQRMIEKEMSEGNSRDEKK